MQTLADLKALIDAVILDNERVGISANDIDIRFDYFTPVREIELTVYDNLGDNYLVITQSER